MRALRFTPERRSAGPAPSAAGADGEHVGELRVRITQAKPLGCELEAAEGQIQGRRVHEGRRAPAVGLHVEDEVRRARVEAELAEGGGKGGDRRQLVAQESCDAGRVRLAVHIHRPRRAQDRTA